MTSRQHAGAKLTINKTGKTRSATATPPLRGRVSVWLWRWCAGRSACSAKNSPCLTSKSPPTPQDRENQ